MNQERRNHTLTNSTRRIFLFIGMLIATMSFGQVQTQKGVSYRYNGKNPRTPLPNVTVECATANNLVISDSTGNFTLTFNKLKMGDRMGLVTVKKREMMVFNQHAVDEWSIRKEPLCLILCDANEFDRQKQELIAIGKHEAEKKYEHKKSDLEKQLKASLIDRAQYEAKLDTAYEELARLHKHIDEYADLFARIDESEIDTLAQQAMDLFKHGKVDEATRLFEQGNYLEKLKADNRTIQQADQLIETAKQVKAKAEEEKEMHLNSLKAQVEAYKTQNEWEKVGVLLKDLADELNTFESLFEYANFCQNQNAFNEAETYYLKALSIVRQLTKDNPQTYESESYEPALAVVLSEFATLYFTDVHRLQKSETMLLEAIEIQTRLVKESPKAHEAQLAESLSRLAILYQKEGRFKESEKTFLEALEVNKRMAKESPQTYEYDLANVLDNLAALYHDADKPRESEEMHIEALEIYRGLAKDNPKAYEPDMAKALVNLGILYKNTRRFEESETLYAEALDILVRLNKENPEAHAYDLATTYFNLALLYAGEKRLWECEEAFLKALELYRQLSENNPQAYKADLALTLFKLGLLMSDENQWFGEGIQVSRYEEAIPYYEEALPFYRELASNSSSYIDYYLAILYKLSNLYTITMDHAKQYELNEEWLPLLHELCLEEPDEWAMDYLMTMDIQASNCIFVGQFELAEQYAREILSIIPSWQGSYTSLGASLLFQGKFDEAAQIFQQHKEEYKDAFLLELDRFEAAGVISEERKADVERVRKMLTE